MNPVRIGMIGAGNMGQCAHLRNYLAVGGCEVVALAEVRHELSEKVAQRYGIPRVYPNHRELLANEKLDAIVAIQQFQMHGQLIPELLSHDVPVLIEKPLARSVEAGSAILTAAQKADAKLFIGYHKRSDPAVAWARHRIAQWKSTGEMGRMTLVRITMPPGDWMAGGFADLIRSNEPAPALAPDQPETGLPAESVKRFDAFVNYYIHQVNLMRHLMDEDYHVRFADPAGIALVAKSDSGVTGILEMGPYRTTIGWQESALICFEKGWIRLDLPAPLAIDRAGSVTVYEDPGDGKAPVEFSPVLPQVHAMRKQAENFIHAVRGEQTCLCQAPEALRDLQIARRYIDMRTGG
jgi:predicted dehydrogenase